MRKVLKIAVLLVGMLPASPLKNRMLNAFGHRVHRSTGVSPIAVFNVGELTVGENTRIGFGTAFRNLRRVTLAVNATIGRFNVISAAPIYRQAYSPEPELHGVLEAGDCTLISRQHVLDCSGGIILEDFASIAGHGTLVYSHSVNLKRYTMGCAPTRIKEASFVGARCSLASGSTLPARSALAMGAVLMPGATESEALYAGIPAKPVESGIGHWKAFNTGSHEGALRTRERRDPDIEREPAPDG